MEEDPEKGIILDLFESSNMGKVNLRVRCQSKEVKGSPIELSSPTYLADYSSFSEPFQEISDVGCSRMQLNHPLGMAVDNEERLFVADTNNNGIQCFD